MIGLVTNVLEINPNPLGCIILHRVHFKTLAILGVETIEEVHHLIQTSRDQIFQGFKTHLLETNDLRFITNLIVGFDLNDLHFVLHLGVVQEGQIHPHLAVVLAGQMNLHSGMIDLIREVHLMDNSLHSNLLQCIEGDLQCPEIWTREVLNSLI